MTDTTKPVSANNPPASRGNRRLEYDIPADGQTKAGATMEKDSTEEQRLQEDEVKLPKKKKV